MWLRDGDLAIWVLSFLVELIETCKNLTRTCGESKGTSGDLNKTCKIFLLCFTIITLVFDRNFVGGFTPNCLKLC
jgi:hypothetical protein